MQTPLSIPVHSSLYLLLVLTPPSHGPENAATPAITPGRMSEGSETTVPLAVVVAVAAAIIVVLVAVFAVLLRYAIYISIGFMYLVDCSHPFHYLIHRFKKVSSRRTPLDLNVNHPVRNNVVKPNTGYIDTELREEGTKGHHTWPRTKNLAVSAGTPGVYEEIDEPLGRQEQAPVSCSYVYEDMSGGLEGRFTGGEHADVPGWIYEEMQTSLPVKGESSCDAATKRRLSASSTL